MNNEKESEHFKVVVIGAAQAGLAVGYYLSEFGIPYLIVDANQHVGDSWRLRWNSLRLFTPAKFDSLPGMDFPSAPDYFPTKNEMADYLESYAKYFKLPIRSGVKVNEIQRKDNVYHLITNNGKIEAENVVVAMSSFQNPKIPSFAKDIKTDITQFHSFNYRSPSQFQKGDVLIVGAGNSGAEIAIEAARNNFKVWLAGRDTGHVPFKIDGLPARIFLTRLILRFLFHRVLTIKTPIGRKARPKVISQGGPLIRVKPKQMTEAGIQRIPRVTGVSEGLPLLENQQVLDVKNIVWCTGFHNSFPWIKTDSLSKDELHDRGIVKNEPGLYFVGLHFQYAFSSAMIHGVSRDAKFVARTISNKLK